MPSSCACGTITLNQSVITGPWEVENSAPVGRVGKGLLVGGPVGTGGLVNDESKLASMRIALTPWALSCRTQDSTCAIGGKLLNDTYSAV